jgi:hypothetical protein
MVTFLGWRNSILAETLWGKAEDSYCALSKFSRAVDQAWVDLPVSLYYCWQPQSQKTDCWVAIDTDEEWLRLAWLGASKSEHTD